MSAATDRPALRTDPVPRRWTVAEFHRMADLGVFNRGCGRRYVMLLGGEIIEQHHGDPADPSPRPFRFTGEQYAKLGEAGYFRGQRVELIGGRVLVMSPMNDPHAHGIVLVLHAVQAAFGPNYTFRPQLPMRLSAGDEPEPDLAVVAGPPRANPTHPTTALLVIEVSDTTIDYDTTTKAELYAAAGIPDYWVLDLVSRRLLVFRDPAPVTAGGAAYRTHRTYGPVDTVAPLAAPAAAIPVADLLP